MRDHRQSLAARRSIASVSVGVLAALLYLTAGAPLAAASPAAPTSAARLAAPIALHAAAQQQEQEEQTGPPPVRDPANGFVLSLLGGSVFSGASSFQMGGAIAYFFGAKATVGFEAEGVVTFGPNGKTVHGMGSLVLQAGARTSKFVPYFSIGLGYTRAKLNLPRATQDALNDLGVVPSPESESGPMIGYGGGVRFYLKEGLALRVDARFSQVLLDLPDKDFFDRLYPIRRIAGMVSLDF